MPYINVNDAYILDNTGKQVDDAVDYALYNSNRNLLDNPWFTVNQRGFSSNTVSAATLCVDRWYIARCIASLSGNVISMTVSSGSANAYLAQHIDKTFINSLVGQTVTLSAIIDGTLRTLTGVVKSNGDFNGVVATGITFALENHIAGYGEFVVYISDTATHTISRVKLELGSYSTLANDVPPKKRSALADCQERFLRVKSDTTVGVVGFGSQTQSDRAYILIPTPVTMELNANNTMSVSLTGTARLVGNGSGSINVTSVSFVSREANGVLIACFGSNIAANQTYNLYLTSGSYIDLSADL